MVKSLKFEGKLRERMKIRNACIILSILSWISLSSSSTKSQLREHPRTLTAFLTLLLSLS